MQMPLQYSKGQDRPRRRRAAMVQEWAQAGVSVAQLMPAVAVTWMRRCCLVMPAWSRWKTTEQTWAVAWRSLALQAWWRWAAVAVAVERVQRRHYRHPRPRLSTVNPLTRCVKPLLMPSAHSSPLHKPVREALQAVLAVLFLTQCVLVLPAIVHRNFAKAVAQSQGDASALPSLGEQVQDILFNFAQRQMPVQYCAAPLPA